MNRIRLFIIMVLIFFCTVSAAAQSGKGTDERGSSGLGVPAAPEDGGPRNWQVTGVSSALNLREQPRPQWQEL